MDKLDTNGALSILKHPLAGKTYHVSILLTTVDITEDNEALRNV